MTIEFREATMTPAPQRRWFRWSLRTLFVVVLVFACVAGWLVREVHLVNQRREFSEAMFGKGGYFYFDANAELPEVPWWREWLGDYGVEQIRVPYAHEAEFRSEAKRLFPEAMFAPSPKSIARMSSGRNDSADVRNKEGKLHSVRVPYGLIPSSRK